MERRGFLARGLMLAAAGPGTNAFPQAEAPLRVGVLSLGRCVERYERMKENEQEMISLRDRFNREAVELRKQIEELGERMQRRLEPPLYVETVRLRGHAEYDLKLSQEVMRRQLRDLALEQESRVLFEIRRVVALVAKEKKLHLVLRADDPPAAPEDPENPARTPPPSREMLFHEDALDVTHAVVDRLNAEWKEAWSCARCRRKTAGDSCPCAPRKP